MEEPNPIESLEFGDELPNEKLLPSFASSGHVIPQSTKLADHFPFAEVRPGQTRAMQAIETGVERKKRVILWEAPTGAGKSPVALATASWATQIEQDDHYEPGAYILSTQKTLVEQYMRDFTNKGLVQLKGKANYRCHGYNIDIGQGGCATGSRMDGDTDPCTACPAKQAKANFMEAPYGTTTFAYFLTEAQYVGKLKPRQFLIVDECHNAEQQILGFTEIEITIKRCEECGVSHLPTFEMGDHIAVRDWLHKVFNPAAETYIRSLKLDAKEANFELRRNDAIKLLKRAESFERFYGRIGEFMKSEALPDWACYTDDKTGSLHIKPLTAALFADRILLNRGKYALMMSATILDPRTFARNLGLSYEQCGILRMQSDFPVANRPIYYKPCGSMSFKTIDETLHTMIPYVERILRKYPDKKGIIHCHSYKVLNALLKHFRGTDQFWRLIYHDSSSGSRDYAVFSHTSTPEPTVLISPSMTEGLDLKDDLSRFQVIMKVPYPFMDPYTKIRQLRDPAWYQWQTALTLIQATGRSIRSATDRAQTYILDSNFDTFMSKNEYMLPKWWLESIIGPRQRQR